MQTIVASFILLCFVTFCSGTTQPVIPNTRAEGCIDGQCSSLCEWDGAKLFPGDSLNQPGKCRLLTCSSNFNIRITTCPFDINGQYKWVGHDDSKLYPECCGTKTKVN